MNKKLTDYVIDLVEILNKQQKQVFWGVFDIISMVVSIIVSYILFYGLINPAPVDYVIYTGLAFLFYQIMIGYCLLRTLLRLSSSIFYPVHHTLYLIEYLPHLTPSYHLAADLF